MTNRALVAVAGIILVAFAISRVDAATIIYEGFQYDDIGAELIGLPNGGGDVDATGLSGTWADAAETGGTVNDMFIKSGDLDFSNLAKAGNHIGFSSNSNSDTYHRALTAEAQTSIDSLGGSSETLYFSFLFEKLQNNFGADHEGLALMNGALPASRFDGSNNPGAVGRHGFAVAATDNSNLRAVGFDGTAGTRVVGTGSISTPAANGGTNTSGSNLSSGAFVRFIVGEISFNTGTGGADVFRLYSVTDDGSLDASDLNLADTIEVDVDESLLNTLRAYPRTAAAE